MPNSGECGPPSVCTCAMVHLRDPLKFTDILHLIFPVTCHHIAKAEEVFALGRDKILDSICFQESTEC